MLKKSNNFNFISLGKEDVLMNFEQKTLQKVTAIGKMLQTSHAGVIDGKADLELTANGILSFPSLFLCPKIYLYNSMKILLRKFFLRTFF